MVNLPSGWRRPLRATAYSGVQHIEHNMTESRPPDRAQHKRAPGPTPAAVSARAATCSSMSDRHFLEAAVAHELFVTLRHKLGRWHVVHLTQGVGEQRAEWPSRDGRGGRLRPAH